ncbi:hypothetical protein JDV02_010244 [Purpureocillium takamizusanense]|uniref:Uncharacterized protein n=1 Tax=Purpureocillium takamizusanense TaxID=2060973 RepID=A0A9Q8QNK5_9HYPO|nr:uncharacterized protein JDV02_010244 [Purpureocillium takamizusanense]UNI24504.1 hypothetical protein JDV02_010244 [Purpureocillium takamizusanense]
MSRQAMDHHHLQDQDLPPPPYSAEAGPSTSPASVVQPPPPPSSSSIFAHHLSTLRTQMVAEQAARATDRELSDARLLGLLVPRIEELLSSIAAVHPPPRLVEAALVPASAVGPDWHCSDQDERRDGELRTVVRVVVDSEDVDGKSSNKSSSKGGDGGKTATAARRSSGGDEDAGRGLWFGDEDTARRLARCLDPGGPVLPTNNMERLAVRARVNRDASDNHDATSTTKRAGGRWGGLFSSSSSSSGSGSGSKKRDVSPKPLLHAPTSASGYTTASSSSSPRRRTDEDVAMAVDAQEVTFRRENEMGIWESRTGWGIVVRVRIRAGS